VIRDDESGLYRPEESTAEFAMRVREELGYGKETVIRTKPEPIEPGREPMIGRDQAIVDPGRPVIDRDRVPRRFTDDDRDRYAEGKVRRALYGEDV
jgi:hypothetical protein